MPSAKNQPVRSLPLDLRIKKTTPLAYFTLLYLSTLKEIEAYVKAGDSRSYRPPVRLDRLGAYRINWPAEIKTYFESRIGDDNPTQLRANHIGTASRDTYKFIRQSTLKFFEDTKNHGITLSKKPPFDFFELFTSAEDPQFNLEMAIRNANITYKLSMPQSDYLDISKLKSDAVEIIAIEDDHADKLTTVSFVYNFKFILDSTAAPSSIRQKIKGAFDVLMRCIIVILKYIFDKRPVQSSFLPGISLKKVELLAAKSLAPLVASRDVRRQSGFFCILREARGTITNYSVNQNCVVRDLLWIRPQSRPILSEGLVEKAGFGFGSRLGYYVSAFDGIIYEIKTIRIQSDYVMLDAIAHLNDDDSLSMCAYFPLMPRSPLRWSFGSVLGHTRALRQPSTISKRTGAWSSIVYHPDWSEDYTNMFSNELSIYTESLRDNEASLYDRNIEKLFDIISGESVVGIITSNTLLSELNSVDREERIRAARCFRDFFHLNNDYDTHLESVIDGVMAKIKGDGAMMRKYIKNIIIEQYMYCLTPSFDPHVIRADHFDDQLSFLSDDKILILRDEYFQKYTQ